MALENKLGITNSAELAREEERISKRKAVELFESGALDKLAPGRFASLQAIHKLLLRGIYHVQGGRIVIKREESGGFMQIIDNLNRTVKSDLIDIVKRGSNLSIAAA